MGSSFLDEEDASRTGCRPHVTSWLQWGSSFLDEEDICASLMADWSSAASMGSSFLDEEDIVLGVDDARRKLASMGSSFLDEEDVPSGHYVDDPSWCFNGVLVSRRGRRTSTLASVCFVAWLQWGPRFSTRKTEERANDDDTDGELQWGPRFSTRKTSRRSR